MSRGTRAVISKEALLHNHGIVRHHAPSSKIWSVVKANAYGHSASLVVNVLNDVADGFAVSTFTEAAAIRDQGITKPILLLEGVTEASHLLEAQRRSMSTVIHCQEQLDHLVYLKLDQPLLRVWIKVDTGMHRLGFVPEQLVSIRQHLSALPQVNVAGVMTHLACADDLENRVATDTQLKQFENIIQAGDVLSIANSASIIDRQECHKDWVRPGIMLYGASPIPSKTALNLSLKPVMTLNSPVIAVRNIPSGDSVGYGMRWTAQRDSVIATLAIGYGDGYPRHAPDGTPIWLNGQKVPLCGRVSMDMIMIDVTDLASVDVGDVAELWGEHLPVDEVAVHIGTIGYELLTRLSPRVPHELV